MNDHITPSSQLSRLQQLTQDVLAEAKRLGATQAEVGIAVDHGFSVSARDGDVETVEYNADKSIDVTVFFGKKTGSASLSDIRPEAVRAAVEAACHIAKFTDDDPASGLPEKEEMAFDYPELTMAYPWQISVPEAIKLACECERMALAHDKRIISSDSVKVATIESLNLYANSHGFIGFYPYTRHDISCVLVAKQGDEMERDYSYTVAVDPNDLSSIEDVAKEAAERTVKRLGAKRLSTRKAPVLFIAEEARTLLGHLMAAISGGNVYRKSTFLLDRVNTPIFPSFVNIAEQPHLPRGLGSAPFDDDGVLTRANQFIRDGVLQSYCLGVYTARQLGLKTTGNAGGVHNLTIQPGEHDLNGLLKTMGKGLLVTEIMGDGVNITTGDYSRGVGGYWVENGEIQYPVHELTIAGHLNDMFGNIVSVGTDVDERSSYRTGSILLADMMIAGQ